nr:hypothetical protein CFP56_23479 [Quercus suber]
MEIGVGRGMWRSQLGMGFRHLGRIWVATVAWDTTLKVLVWVRDWTFGCGSCIAFTSLSTIGAKLLADSTPKTGTPLKNEFIWLSKEIPAWRSTKLPWSCPGDSNMQFHSSLLLKNEDVNRWGAAIFSSALVFLHWVAAGFLHWIAAACRVWAAVFLFCTGFNLTVVFSSALVFLPWVAAGFLHWIAAAISGASTANAATQEALVEAAVKAKWLGFCRILFMCSSKRVAQVCNFSCTPSWQEKTMVADISYLKQQGLCCKVLFVPRIILGSVCSAAKTATRVPGPYSWAHPAFV